MANVNAARGFRKVGVRGKTNIDQVTKYYFGGGGTIAVGDPVVRVTGATMSDPAGMAAAVVRATVGSYVTGHIVGFDMNRSTLTEVGYMLTGDTGYVYVDDDPDSVFEVQEGGSATALTTAQIGQSINAITAVNGSTVIGTSLFQIDNNTVTTASTGTYTLVGLVQRADVAVGAYAKWLVKVNLSTEAVSGASNILAI